MIFHRPSQPPQASENSPKSARRGPAGPPSHRATVPARPPSPGPTLEQVWADSTGAIPRNPEKSWIFHDFPSSQWFCYPKNPVCLAHQGGDPGCQGHQNQTGTSFCHFQSVRKKLGGLHGPLPRNREKTVFSPERHFPSPRLNRALRAGSDKKKSFEVRSDPPARFG